MIDVANESCLSLAQAAKLIPAGRQGRPTSMATVFRWVLMGAQGPGGQRIRLEAVRMGGRWITSKEALQRFAERLTPRFDDGPGVKMRTPLQRKRALERAERELERAGI